MIKIICVGKLKENYLKEAVVEYTKRLSKYTKISIIELNDINNTDINNIIKKEQDEILKYIEPKDYVVALDIDGVSINSKEFANKISDIFISYSNITFVIGGSYGLSDKIKNISHYRMSFSKLTFPHQLFRVNLLEQIYRSFKINNNESYHK